MKHAPLIAVAVVAIIVVAGAAVILNKGGRTVSDDTDFAGYAITPVEDLDGGIVAVGQDSFRWMTYFGVADRCVMVDYNDRTNYMGKAFMYVGKAQALGSNADLKYTSTNCGVTPEDVRTIINLNPSIIIVPAEFESTYPQEMKALRSAGLNVYHIANVYTFLTEGTFELTSEMSQQIDKLGKVLGLEGRAEEIKDFISSTVSDILGLRSGITGKRTGYIGALAYNGAHGLDSSMSYYMPFELAGVENIMKGVKAEGDSASSVATYSATTISERMDDDTVLFMDSTGVYTCTTNTDKGIMELFEGHDAYLACPYIWTGINPENVLVGAYQILRDAYGLLTDEEFERKADAVYAGFLGSSVSDRIEEASKVPVPEEGTSVYDDMSDVYQQRRGNPIHGRISVSADGVVYL